MGDRANIIVKQGRDLSPVFLYTHWNGYNLPERLRVALARRQRWDDNPHLTRIIFDTMTAGQQGGETGYGISTGISDDNSYPLLEVDPDDRKVRVLSEAGSFAAKPPRTLAEFTFDEYVAMEESTWEAITPGGPTLEWMARAMAEHDFEENPYSVMADILQTAGYLAQKQPALLNTVIKNLSRREEGLHPLPYPQQNREV